MNKRLGFFAALMPAAALAVGISSEISPQPAEMMPLADESVVLDVTDTGKRLVAVGERGHILVSLDGETWVQAPTPVRAYLTAVDFADDNNGMAVGHDSTILRTRDGGRSWIVQNFEPVVDPEVESDEPFLDVLMLDTRRAWAVGAYGKLYRTDNGGETWEDFEDPIREDAWHFNSITRLNNGDLFLAGESGTLAVSSDNGDSWEAIESPYSSTLFDAAAVGPEGVLIVGLRGNAYYTADPRGGEWSKLETGVEDSLIGAEQLANGEAIMVGINGIILRTRAALSHVERIDNPQGITLAAVQPLKNALVVVGNAGPQLIANP